MKISIIQIIPLQLYIYIYIYIATVLKFLFQYKTIMDAIIDFETLDLTLQIPNIQLIKDRTPSQDLTN